MNPTDNDGDLPDADAQMPPPDPQEPPIANIVGDRVALGPICRELLPVYTRWRNDFIVARTLDYLPGPFTAEEREAWYARSSLDADTVRFTVYERSPWRAIGLTNLHDIDFREGTAGFGLMIGEADARGQGYGTEATRLVLDYAFTVLGLVNVMLRVYGYNRPALRAYTNAGFREFGRRSQCRVFAGQRWDEVYMECLASGFTSPVLGRLWLPDEFRPAQP
ncbi:MAG: GNAT family N-acetyltransferase [Thermomicrobiales bacterium]